MAITYIRRDWGDVVSIVRVVTTDSLSAAGQANYILNQAANIVAANNGAFTWLPNDVVLVSASDGSSLFNISANFNSLLLNSAGSQQVSIALTAALIDGMFAAPVLLVPAPVAGTLNLVTSATLNINYGGVVFAGGGAIALQYENTVHGAGVLATGTIAAATLIAATANTTLVFPAASSIVSAATIAQALYLSNQTAAFTGGTGTTATLNVVYRNIAAS